MLERRPLHALSVTDIVRESGVSRASFYFYFATKTAVLAALADDACGQLREIWQGWFEGTGGMDVAELRVNFRASALLWTEHRAVLLATVESWRSDPEVGEMWGSLMGGLIGQARTRIVRDRSAGHVMGRGDPETLAETLVWSSERLHYVGLSGIARSLSDPERLVEANVALWSRLLGS
jgi:AcrR family transcriptional regulator